MKKIFIKFRENAAGHGLAYSEGEEAEVNEGYGEELIEQGIAVKLHRKLTALPDDFPGVKVLAEHGYTSVDQLRAIATVEQLSELKGIGQKLALKIIETLK